MDIGKRIEQLREQKGLSQNRLAKLARISQSSLSEIEAGKRSPRYDTLSLIAKALDIATPEPIAMKGDVPIWVSDPGTLGVKIQKMRKKIGMSDRELAELSNIPYLEIYLIESGNNELLREGQVSLSYEKVRAIAKALNVKPTVLTGSFFEEDKEKGFIRFTFERDGIDPVILNIDGEAYKKLKQDELIDLFVSEVPDNKQG